MPVLSEGDVNARVWIRVREVEQSLALIDQILDQLPEGPLRHRDRAAAGTARGHGDRRGISRRHPGLAPPARWLVERCHLRDPSWFQWPLLEAVIEGNIVADFPLCNKSFNCSYSGQDI